jgi:hypothetical protein
MNKKYYSDSGGRVGGVFPPYRDHQVNKVTSVNGGLDTPFATNAQGYSTTEGFI